MESEYSWQAVRTGPGYHRDPVTRNYGWWVMLASVLAALFHVALFLAFEKIELRHFSPSGETVFHLKQERISIDKLTDQRLNEEDKTPPPVAEPPREEPPVEEPKMEEGPEVTGAIRLTPGVTEPQNLFAAAPAPDFSKAADMGKVEQKMEFEFGEVAAGEAVKGDLLKASQKISAQQPKMYMKAGEIQMGLESDQLVKEMTKTLGGSEAAKIRGRFDSLDELLGAGKSMPEKAEILIPTDLLFEFGSAEVREEAKLSLMKLGVLIMANPKSTFLFKGYTDSIPFRFNGERFGPKDNTELSLARAAAVRDWLSSSLDLRGFDLQIKGYGDSNPLVPPSPLENVEIRKVKEALNRRVEVEIISRR